MNTKPLKILTIVGARPQFVKAAMVSRAIIAANDEAGEEIIMEDIVHTGQHYDPEMSQIFFDDMGIPRPVVNLEVGSGSHACTTAEMMIGLEREMIERKPDWVLVYGDTNSTLAAALAASKIHIPVAHVEAGLRSYNRLMPEEINRVLTDYMADLRFCPTSEAIGNLQKEGIEEGVFHTGDVMYDAAILFARIAQGKSTVLDDLQLSSKSYYLATVHRAENTDDEQRLQNIFRALNELGSSKCPVVLPLHPRTRAALARLDMRPGKNNSNDPESGFPQDPGSSVRFISPVSFLDMVMLERNARAILTDSGGVQKEAYFHRVPCVTLRNETEWVETVDAGWNIVVGANVDAIRKAVLETRETREIVEYGDGEASTLVLETLKSFSI